MADLTYAHPDKHDWLCIDIVLGDVCNYACSYCPAYLNAGAMGWITPNHFANFAKQVRRHYQDRVITYRVSGGEPTVSRHFRTFSDIVRSSGSAFTIVSNGSRTLRWWRDNLSAVDGLYLSFHPESAVLADFAAVCDLIGDTVPLTVQVMMAPSLWETAKTALHHLDDLGRGRFTVIPKIVYNRDTNLPQPYSASQTAFIASFVSSHRRSASNLLHRGDMVWHDGSVADIPGMMLAQRNRFDGWSCWAGLHGLAVSKEGNIYVGQCQFGGEIGHIADAAIAFPTAPVVCDGRICACPSDLYVRKTSP